MFIKLGDNFTTSDYVYEAPKRNCKVAWRLNLLRPLSFLFTDSKSKFVTYAYLSLISIIRMLVKFTQDDCSDDRSVHLKGYCLQTVELINISLTSLNVFKAPTIQFGLIFGVWDLVLWSWRSGVIRSLVWLQMTSWKSYELPVKVT